MSVVTLVLIALAVGLTIFATGFTLGRRREPEMTITFIPKDEMTFAPEDEDECQA